MYCVCTYIYMYKHKCICMYILTVLYAGYSWICTVHMHTVKRAQSSMFVHTVCNTQSRAKVSPGTQSTRQLLFCKIACMYVRMLFGSLYSCRLTY